MGFLLWLASMALIVPVTIGFYVLTHGDAGKTSAFVFLAPFFGALSGWALLGGWRFDPGRHPSRQVVAPDCDGRGGYALTGPEMPRAES